MNRHPRLQAERILRISRVVSDLDRAEAFYRDGLGFHIVTRGRCDTTTLTAFGWDEADEVVMRIGEQDIALVRFATPGRPYPRDSRSDDLWFQHVAIGVDDMDAAYAWVSSSAGWCPISEGGPQLLPESNGGVRAFKFRDPDGHPLELLWVPPGKGRSMSHGPASNTPFLGIDHSALSVFSTPQSVAFYRRLGFRVSERSLNRGSAQSRLDGLPSARTRVTSLRLRSAEGPGLELLAYQPPGRCAETTCLNDRVTDWVTLALNPSSNPSAYAVQDPDGHRLVLIDQGHRDGGMGVPG
jgi:catechol 2,3-dioxygenase-like lactoylglutathione lyase family enzyme